MSLPSYKTIRFIYDFWIFRPKIMKLASLECNQVQFVLEINKTKHFGTRTNLFRDSLIVYRYPDTEIEKN